MIYTPEHFAVTDRKQMFRLMRENSFATMVSMSGTEPVITHLPVLVDEVTATVHAHVARANPVWHDFSDKRELLFIFHGPHHYVSPSWYRTHPSVPTWNYAVVHAKAVAKIINDRHAVEAVLHRLVEEHESRFADPWQMQLPDDYMQRMIDGIVAFEARITDLRGKVKLSQNRPPADRLNVIAALRDTGDAEANRLAHLMEDLVGD